MSIMMTCNVLQAKGELVLEQRPVCEPGLDQVRIRTVCAGICGSDIHALHGLQPSLSFPRVMGHELAGIIDAVGPCDEALPFKVGDRVVIDPSIRCGTCAQCTGGKENICEALQVLGVHCDGGFSEYFLCGSAMVYRMPDGMDFETAVFCEPMSIAMHALSRITCTVKGRIGIIGAGPIGLALLLAVKPICNVVVVFELLEKRKEVARTLGADAVLDPSVPIGSLEELDVVFDAVSLPETSILASRIVRWGGEVVIVGMAKPEAGFPLLSILKKELSVRGTRMTRREDFSAAISLLVKIGAEPVREIVTGSWSLSDSIQAIHYVEQHPEACIKEIIDFRKQ